jgi:hypothetical protein
MRLALTAELLNNSPTTFSWSHTCVVVQHNWYCTAELTLTQLQVRQLLTPHVRHRSLSLHEPANVRMVKGRKGTTHIVLLQHASARAAVCCSNMCVFNANRSHMAHTWAIRLHYIAYASAAAPVSSKFQQESLFSNADCCCRCMYRRYHKPAIGCPQKPGKHTQHSRWIVPVLAPVCSPCVAGSRTSPARPCAPGRECSALQQQQQQQQQQQCYTAVTDSLQSCVTHIIVHITTALYKQLTQRAQLSAWATATATVIDYA